MHGVSYNIQFKWQDGSDSSTCTFTLVLLSFSHHKCRTLSSKKVSLLASLYWLDWCQPALLYLLMVIREKEWKTTWNDVC